MSETMKLLEKALATKNAATWARELHLEKSAIDQCKKKGHVSPTIAGAMAELLGLDATKWIVVAALESARDSECTARMRRKFGRIASL